MNQEFRMLEPEVAGALGEKSVLDYSTAPPGVSKLHYEFEDWLGDDLLTTTPCFIVTDRLRAALEAFGGTGYTFDEVIVSKSDEFDELSPGVDLPEFNWMKIHGVAGADDAGLTADRSLVVSDRLLTLLKSFNISNCTIRRKPFKPKSP